MKSIRDEITLPFKHGNSCGIHEFKLSVRAHCSECWSASTVGFNDGEVEEVETHAQHIAITVLTGRWCPILLHVDNGVVFYVPARITQNGCAWPFMLGKDCIGEGGGACFTSSILKCRCLYLEMYITDAGQLQTFRYEKCVLR